MQTNIKHNLLKQTAVCHMHIYLCYCILTDFYELKTINNRITFCACTENHQHNN